MTTTLAFDVYGTLIDTQGVTAELHSVIGSEAETFSQTWREKQLEYSFRRGLMQNYESFDVCIRNAFDYTCTLYGADFTPAQKNNLLETYHTLPAFNDVRDGLINLKANNYRLYAFSNGTAKTVEGLLVSAGIRDYFEGIVSVDDVKSFKPNPEVYKHFLKSTNSKAQDSWLISANPFDVIGAISSEMNAAWIKRSAKAIFDPWGIEPTVIVENLIELHQTLPAN
jgi:2-haloacid dehalogenase